MGPLMLNTAFMPLYMLTKYSKRKCLISYLNIKNLHWLDYMEKGWIIFLLVGLDHPSVSVARYPSKEKVTLCIFTRTASSPDDKGLIPVNRSSISRISLLSNCCVLSVGPTLNKPSKPGYGIKPYPYFLLTQRRRRSGNETPHQCRSP